MSEVDENRDLLHEAQLLEEQRIEIIERAIKANVADLLPPLWMKLDEGEEWRKKTVHICWDTALEPGDEERYTERDCRNLIGFLAHIAEEKRLAIYQRQLEEDTDDAEEH
jgi:hypothetical protein